MFLFCSLLNLQQFNDSTILLCWGLNLLLNTSNIPALAPHHLKSMTWSPSQPSKFSIIWDPFAFLYIASVGRKNVFISVLKLHGSGYLSVASQSNIDCLSAGSCDLGVIYIGLALSIWLYASLIAIICCFGSFSCYMHYCLCHALFSCHSFFY